MQAHVSFGQRMIPGKAQEQPSHITAQCGINTQSDERPRDACRQYGRQFCRIILQSIQPLILQPPKSSVTLGSIYMSWCLPSATLVSPLWDPEGDSPLEIKTDQTESIVQFVTRICSRCHTSIAIVLSLLNIHHLWF